MAEVFEEWKNKYSRYINELSARLESIHEREAFRAYLNADAEQRLCDKLLSKKKQLRAEVQLKRQEPIHSNLPLVQEIAKLQTLQTEYSSIHQQLKLAIQACRADVRNAKSHSESLKYRIFTQLKKKEDQKNILPFLTLPPRIDTRVPRTNTTTPIHTQTPSLNLNIRHSLNNSIFILQNPAQTTLRSNLKHGSDHSMGLSFGLSRLLKKQETVSLIHLKLLSKEIQKKNQTSKAFLSAELEKLSVLKIFSLYLASNSQIIETLHLSNSSNSHIIALISEAIAKKEALLNDLHSLITIEQSAEQQIMSMSL